MDHITKEDLIDAVRDLATKKDLEALAKAADLVQVEDKLDRLAEQVNELSALFRLRERIDRMAENIRQKLHVEV